MPAVLTVVWLFVWGYYGNALVPVVVRDGLFALYRPDLRIVGAETVQNPIIPHRGGSSHTIVSVAIATRSRVSLRLRNKNMRTKQQHKIYLARIPTCRSRV